MTIDGMWLVLPLIFPFFTADSLWCSSVFFSTLTARLRCSAELVKGVSLGSRFELMTSLTLVLRIKLLLMMVFWGF